MTVAPRLTPERRDQIAADALARYDAGEGWAEIGARHGITGAHARRLTAARYDIAYRRWGQFPVADPDEVIHRRDAGQSLEQIAQGLGHSRQAVRTALEAAGRSPVTRYPRLSQRRTATAAELEDVGRLYEACPPAPRAREGARDIRGDEGHALATACRALVDQGIPMATLSRSLDHGPTWVHWLLSCHDLRPSPRAAQTTARRTLP